MIVYAIVASSLSPTSPLGDALETFVRREDAERFVEEVRGDDPEARDVADCSSLDVRCAEVHRTPSPLSGALRVFSH